MIRPMTLAVLVALTMGSSASAAEPTIEELLSATDDVTRGESSEAVVEMHVKTDRYERTMRMQIWSLGTEKTLIRVLEPAKDAGISTLKVDDNIWNYLPKIDRTIKVPSGMMSGNWMGSHFTNDDLVKENRLSEDFDAEMTERPADNEAGVYVITLIPKPDAPVVWSRIVARIRPDKMPVSIEYYDDDNELARTMTFKDYRTFDGRKAPSVMRLVPAREPDEFTEFKYVSLEFGVKIPASKFTQQALRR